MDHVICLEWKFISSFPISMTFFSLDLLPRLGLPILCWIKVVRLGIPVSLLILEEKFTAEYDISFGLLIMALILLKSIPSMPTLLRVFNQKQMFFLKCFLSTAIIIWFLYLIWLIGCTILTFFADAESSLHPLNTSHLITRYVHYSVLWNSRCKYLVENFCTSDDQRSLPVTLFSCGILV